MEQFSGAKVAIITGDKVITYLRDERDDIPYSGMWDLPGGGRENEESPEECVLRELYEEFSIRLEPSDLIYKLRRRNAVGHLVYFFVSKCDCSILNDIKFGSEGQYWQAMEIKQFLKLDKVLPHLKEELENYVVQYGIHL